MKKRFIFLILGAVITLSGLSTPFIYAAVKNENVENIEVIDSDALTGNITVKASFDKDLNDAKNFVIESKSGKKIKSQTCFKTNSSFFESSYNIYFNDVTIVNDTFRLIEWKNNKGETRTFANQKTFDVIFDTPFELKEIKINDDFDSQDSSFVLSGILINPRKYEINEITCSCNGVPFSIELQGNSFSKTLNVPEKNTTYISFENISFQRNNEKTLYPISYAFSFDKSTYQTSEIQSLEFINGVFNEDVLYSCSIKVKETKFKNASEMEILEDGLLKKRKIYLKETVNNIATYSFVAEAKCNITITSLKYSEEKTYYTNFSIDVFPKSLIDTGNISISGPEAQITSERYNLSIFIANVSGKLDFSKIEFSLGPDEHIIADFEKGDFLFNRNIGLITFSNDFLDKFSEKGPYHSKKEILNENDSNKIEILFTLEKISFCYTTTCFNYNTSGEETIAYEKISLFVDEINLIKKISIEKPLARFQNFITSLDDDIDDWTWGGRTIEIQCLMSFSHNPYTFKPEKWFYKYNGLEDKTITYLPYETSYHFSVQPLYTKDDEGLDEYKCTFSIYISEGESVVFKPFADSEYLSEKVFFEDGITDISKNLECLVDVRESVSISASAAYRDATSLYSYVPLSNNRYYFSENLYSLNFEIDFSSNSGKSFFSNIKTSSSKICSYFYFDNDESTGVRPNNDASATESCLEFEVENEDESFSDSQIYKIEYDFETMLGASVSFSSVDEENYFSPSFESFSEKYGFHNNKIDSSALKMDIKNKNFKFQNDSLFADIKNETIIVEKIILSNTDDSKKINCIFESYTENTKTLKFELLPNESFECSYLTFVLKYSGSEGDSYINYKYQLTSNIYILEDFEKDMVCCKEFKTHNSSSSNKLWKIYIKVASHDEMPVSSARSDAYLKGLSSNIKKITAVDETANLRKLLAESSGTVTIPYITNDADDTEHYFKGNVHCTPLTGDIMHQKPYEYVEIELKTGKIIKVPCTYKT